MVNLTALEAVVEGIIAEVERGATEGTLRLVTGITPDIILARWGFQVYTPSNGRPEA